MNNVIFKRNSERVKYFVICYWGLKPKNSKPFGPLDLGRAVQTAALIVGYSGVFLCLFPYVPVNDINNHGPWPSVLSCLSDMGTKPEVTVIKLTACYAVMFPTAFYVFMSLTARLLCSHVSDSPAAMQSCLWLLFMYSCLWQPGCYAVMSLTAQLLCSHVSDSPAAM